MISVGPPTHSDPSFRSTGIHGIKNCKHSLFLGYLTNRIANPLPGIHPAIHYTVYPFEDLGGKLEPKWEEKLHIFIWWLQVLRFCTFVYDSQKLREVI